MLAQPRRWDDLRPASAASATTTQLTRWTTHARAAVLLGTVLEMTRACSASRRIIRY